MYFFVGGLHLRLSHGLVVGFAHRGGRRRRGVAACCVAHDSRRKDSDRTARQTYAVQSVAARKFICAYPPSAAVREKNQCYRAGKMVEVNAVTDENEDIPTGAAVVVDSVVSDGLVVVKKQ